jgi:hypothetical protein
MNRIQAAHAVARNPRLQQRLPLLSALAIELQFIFIPERGVDAWLVYESEYDIHPVCLFYEPKSCIDFYFKIEKVKILRNPKGIVNE